MQSQPAISEQSIQPCGHGRFSWAGLLLGLPAGVMVGLLAARIAESAQFDLHFTPLLLFPLLVGIGLGAMVVGLVRLAQVGHRPTIVLATVLAVAVAVAGQHYLQYQASQEKTKWFDTVRRAFPDLPEDRIPPSPASFFDYLHGQATAGRPIVGSYVARGAVAWLSWAADALLVLAAALTMVIPAIRQPYCNRCGSWYRTIRGGRTDADIGRRLAMLAGLPAPEKPLAARYRLASCMGGCGPTRFELSWEDSAGGRSLDQSWLDAACRNRLMQALDETAAKNAE